MDPSTIQKLRTTVRGAVLCPGQDGYDAARTIPNAMIDRRPAAHRALYWRRRRNRLRTIRQ